MLWLKAFHIISMVAWFAGLFYLPRLFVYHAMAEDRVSVERFKVMEKKLYYAIMMPSAFFTVFFGLLILYFYSFYPTWLYIKLALVMGLLIYHFYCGKIRKDFYYNRNVHTAIFYRVFNEIPVIFLVLIVILVIIKPF